MTTDHLGIPDIAANQNQKEVTANTAHNLLDFAMNRNVSKAITVSTSFTTIETRENAIITLTGTPGSAFTVDMPDTNKRLLIVQNDTNATVTIRNSAAGGTGQPVIPIGAASQFHYDGTNFVEYQTFTPPVQQGGAAIAAQRFRGALVEATGADQVIPSTSTWTKVLWDTAVYDTDSFFDNANDELLIPAGVTKVRVAMSIQQASTAASNWGFRILKNGTTLFKGAPVEISGLDGFTNNAMTIHSAIVDVVQGDNFEAQAIASITTMSIDASVGNTWFSIEVLEADPVGDLGLENLITNGCFRVANRGTLFTAATAIVNNDDTILLDRWNLLADGADTVDVSQETTTVPAGADAAMKSLVATANRKWGFVQILPHADAEKIIGKTASLQFKARTTTAAALNNIRAAIISWNSTADAPTTDIVSIWNAAGTDPTLVANWTYENVPANLVMVVDTYTLFTIENVNIDTASAANVAVFIWVDDTDAAVNDELFIGDVKLNLGAVCTGYEMRPFTEEEGLCDFWYWKTFPRATAVAQNAGVDGSVFYSALLAGVNVHTMLVPFPRRMFKSPTITFYNPSAANTLWRNITDAGDSGAATAEEVSDRGVTISNAGVATDGVGDDLRIHLSADAEF